MWANCMPAARDHGGLDTLATGATAWRLRWSCMLSGPRRMIHSQSMTWEESYQALKRLPIGTSIPKVESTKNYQIKAWYYKDGEEQFSYTVANKAFPVSWICGCFEELRKTGELRTAWFRESFYDGEDLGGCNFTTIGGLFILIGIAKRARKGLYVSI